MRYTDRASVYDLGQPEQLVASLASVPDVKFKLRADVMKKDFQRKSKALQNSFDIVTSALNDVIHSSRLQQFMNALLNAVNFLNEVLQNKNG